jgi:thiamine pyrophosphate-dependent acetolactate synthase large subunit-like protein
MVNVSSCSLTSSPLTLTVIVWLVSPAAKFTVPLCTELAQTDYHLVAQGHGGEGFCADNPAQVVEGLKKGKEMAGNGRPVLINVLIGKTDFRKGSISM